MLTLAISALSFASSPITQAPAGAASEADCDAMCGKDSACSDWSSCTDGADDAGAMAQVLGENCYMPWPPSGWPPSWVCPTAAGPPALGGDTEGKDCSTLTEPGGPAAEGIPSNYWGAIAMDNTIIDKSDDIVAQLRKQDYQKGTLQSIRMRRNWRKGRARVGQDDRRVGRARLHLPGPIDGTATCNVRPPASTARPAATASTPSPAAPHPHAPHRPTTRPPPLQSGGDDEATNGVCNDGGRGGEGFCPSDAAAACIVKLPGEKALCKGYGEDCFDCGPRPKIPYAWKANTR